MGLGMRPKIDFPTPPRWSTANPSSTTTEPLESRKDTGAAANDQPPAPQWNWLLNAQYETMQRCNSVFVSNWWHGETGLGDNYKWCQYHPEIGKWIIGLSTGYNSSIDGKNWSPGLLRTFNTEEQITGIDATRFIVCGIAGTLEHSTDAVSWSSETVTGMSDKPSAICTKYPDSDYTVVGGDGGEVYISTTGIGGTWNVATTPPSTSSSINTIVRTASNTFVAVTGTGYSFISTDGGDVWAATTQDPRDAFGTMGVYHVAANADDDNDSPVICAAGASVITDGSIARSIDGGDTWTAATIVQDVPVSVAQTLRGVYYCGGKIWVACGDLYSGPVANILVSHDNGANWRRVAYNDPQNVAIDDLYGICSDGKQLVLAGDAGINLHSLAYPSSTEG